MLRRHRAAHRAIWLALAALLPVIFATGLASRLRAPADDAPSRLAPPAEAPR